MRRRAVSFLLQDPVAKAFRLDGVHLGIALHFCKARAGAARAAHAGGRCCARCATHSWRVGQQGVARRVRACSAKHCTRRTTTRATGAGCRDRAGGAAELGPARAAGGLRAALRGHRQRDGAALLHAGRRARGRRRAAAGAAAARAAGAEPRLRCARAQTSVRRRTAQGKRCLHSLRGHTPPSPRASHVTPATRVAHITHHMPHTHMRARAHTHTHTHRHAAGRRRAAGCWRRDPAVCAGRQAAAGAV
jgi:hypothetical protein